MRVVEEDSKIDVMVQSTSRSPNLIMEVKGVHTAGTEYVQVWEYCHRVCRETNSENNLYSCLLVTSRGFMVSVYGALNLDVEHSKIVCSRLDYKCLDAVERAADFFRAIDNAIFRLQSDQLSFFWGGLQIDRITSKDVLSYQEKNPCIMYNAILRTEDV